MTQLFDKQQNLVLVKKLTTILIFEFVKKCSCIAVIRVDAMLPAGNQYMGEHCKSTVINFYIVY